jgi:hypothetical protein
VDALKEKTCRNWKAAVLDVNGHFVVAAPARIKGRTQLIVFNSTEGGYLNAGAYTAALAFDLVQSHAL